MIDLKSTRVIISLLSEYLLYGPYVTIERYSGQRIKVRTLYLVNRSEFINISSIENEALFLQRYKKKRLSLSNISIPAFVIFVYKAIVIPDYVSSSSKLLLLSGKKLHSEHKSKRNFLKIYFVTNLETVDASFTSQKNVRKCFFCVENAVLYCEKNIQFGRRIGI